MSSAPHDSPSHHCRGRGILRWEGQGHTPDDICQGHPLPPWPITTIIPSQVSAAPGIDVRWRLRLWQCERLLCFSYEYLFHPAVIDVGRGDPYHTSQGHRDADHGSGSNANTHTHTHAADHVYDHGAHIEAEVGSSYPCSDQYMEVPQQQAHGTTRPLTSPPTESSPSSPESPSSASPSSLPSSVSPASAFPSSTPAADHSYSPLTPPNSDDDADGREPPKELMLKISTAPRDDTAQMAATATTTERDTTPTNPNEFRWSRRNDQKGYRNFLWKRKHGTCPKHRRTKKACFCDTASGDVKSWRAPVGH